MLMPCCSTMAKLTEFWRPIWASVSMNGKTLAQRKQNLNLVSHDDQGIAYFYSALFWGNVLMHVYWASKETSSERRSLKSTTSKLIIFGHRLHTCSYKTFSLWSASQKSKGCFSQNGEKCEIEKFNSSLFYSFLTQANVCCLRCAW